MIASPNFPSNYGNNENCEWNLRGPTGHFLTLTFLTFNLESSSSCNSADYLEIRDVNSTGTTSVWDSFKFSCEILFFLNWLFVKSFQCDKSYCFNNQYVLILVFFTKARFWLRCVVLRSRSPFWRQTVTPTLSLFPITLTLSPGSNSSLRLALKVSKKWTEGKVTFQLHVRSLYITIVSQNTC